METMIGNQYGDVAKNSKVQKRLTFMAFIPFLQIQIFYISALSPGGHGGTPLRLPFPRNCCRFLGLTVSSRSTFKSPVTSTLWSCFPLAVLANDWAQERIQSHASPAWCPAPLNSFVQGQPVGLAKTFCNFTVFWGSSLPNLILLPSFSVTSLHSFSPFVIILIR